MMEINRITVCSPGLQGGPYTFAFFSDLHNSPYEDCLEAARGVDAILMTGDILDRHHEGMEYACRFLEDAPKTAPVFFSIGNHEVRSEDWPEYRSLLEKSRVTILDDSFVRLGGIVLGGLSSRDVFDRRLRPDHLPPIRDFLGLMSAQPGYHLLMCHHPEYYPLVIQGTGIDLTLSGHAHGGQIRLFGRGLFAPGQGLFPVYTSGFYEGGRLLVSRGMSNKTFCPRLWNPCELILLTVTGEEGA